MTISSSFRKPVASAFMAVIAIAVLGGCGTSAPTPKASSAPTHTSSAPSQAASAAAGGKLDPATDDLSWDNGNRILGDENGGHTPDLGSGLADPASGWQGDFSKMQTEGTAVYTSENTQCQVTTAQYRNAPAELVAGDDKASTLNILSILFNGNKDLLANTGEGSLSYGLAHTHGVDMTAVNFKSPNGYESMLVRTFSKPGVTLGVSAVCPSLDTLKSTLAEVSKTVTINAL